MPKVHFFRLAQELGRSPIELQKRLAAEGIAVKTTSTMLDDETAARIRELLQQAASAHAKPVPETAQAAEPEQAPAPTPAAPISTVAPIEAPPVTRIIKRLPDDSKPTAVTTEGRAGEKTIKVRKGRPNLLIRSEADGGLSPDAEFGIVKAAGTVPAPQPRPGAPRREPGPRAPRAAESYPREAPSAAAPQEVGKGALKGTGRAPAAAPDKKKQKRTVFSEKEKTRLQNRKADIGRTAIRSRRPRRVKVRSEAGPIILDEPIIVTGPMTVGELAERAHVRPAQVITQLLSMGVLATVNQQVEPQQATAALEKLGIEALFESELVEQAAWRLTASGVAAAGGGELRPPVVTILGHVDHGKTTLLDSIRKTNVTAQEFGGITQHIGAYQVEVNDRRITFLDTPGHAAFTAMRARGANLTDIAVLVVAADDGIQPQTVEAIDHARAAHVPIIAAINKIDLPDAQPDAVKEQLSGYGLVAEEWGGDTIMVPVSAKQGANLEHLLEMILLVADVQELRAQADNPARGAVVESKLDKQRGPVATVLVQEGTLRVGEAVVVGMISGKVRAMSDYKGRKLQDAGPSTPVEITGLSEVPVAGDLFEVVENERKAREIAEKRRMKARLERLQATVSLQDLSNMVATGLVQDLNLIVKADVAGSVEAISHALSEVEHEEIRINIIHAGVGDVTESDVLLASASQAIVIAFHARVEPLARSIAEEAGVDVRVYQVIYDLVDDVKKAMTGMLAPIFEEIVLGRAEVRATFRISRLGTIAGCYVIEGRVRRGSKARVIRGGETIHTGTLDSLKHLKEDVREMAQGFECGISLDSFSAWQEGDIIESFVMQEQHREPV